MKYLLVVPVILWLAGCTYSLAPRHSAQSEGEDQSTGDQPIAESALSEMGLKSVLAPPGILSPGGTAEAPESALFPNNAQTVNALPATSLPPSSVNGGAIQGSTPTATSGFPPTVPTVGARPNVPSLGSVGPGSGAGNAAGVGPSF